MVSVLFPPTLQPYGQDARTTNESDAAGVNSTHIFVRDRYNCRPLVSAVDSVRQLPVRGNRAGDPPLSGPVGNL